MNDEQERIEEMAKVIMDAVPETIQYAQAPANETEARIEAKALYAAGYRKQSDTAMEIVKRLKELLHKHEYRSQIDGVPFYQMNAESFCDEINELAAEYGVEVDE